LVFEVGKAKNRTNFVKNNKKTVFLSAKSNKKRSFFVRKIDKNYVNFGAKLCHFDI